MRYLICLLMVVGCANLERGSDPTDVPPETPTLDGGVVELPDAGTPVDAPPDACEPPPPQCECDNDCDDGEKCHNGKCYERCWCDDDCDHGYDCRYGLCKLKY